MIAFLLAALLASVSGKVSTITVQLNEENPWRYLTKFAVSIGKGSWTAKAKFTKPVDDSSADDVKLMISVYLDENWE
jgi:hypothetical protein